MTAIAVLFLCALPGFVLARLSAFAPIVLAAALFAIPADEARAHNDNSATLHAETYPLHEAAKTGDLDSVNHFITVHMADVNATIIYGKTPLHEAARYGHASVVSVLIAAGADVNAKNSGDFTPLHNAATYGHDVSVVSILIAAGADVNAKDNINGWTPLHGSARGGSASVASILLAAEADVNAKDDNGWTPLHRAAYEGYASVVSILIAAEADVNAKDNNGWTPLHWSAANKRASVVSILLSMGADVNAETNRGETPLRRAEWTTYPVLIAAGGHWGVACASPLFVNPSRHSPPCLCPFHTENDDDTGAKCHADHAPINHDLGDWLDSIRADNPTLILHFVSQHDESPNQLIYAINNSAPRAIKALIERGANVDQRDSRGDTPLHLAAQGTDTPENTALISLLLDKGANPNLKNNDGWRPLDLAFDDGGARDPRFARRMLMLALIEGGAQWTSECSGGAIPNENYRGLAQVATYPECKCPAHISQRDSGGACECPAHSHSQVNGRCLPQGSAEVDAEIAKMQVELARLRSALVSLNARLSLSAEAPRETVEDIAEQARETAAEIDWRRANFVALGRRAEAGEAPPPVALSDTAAECRMRGGEVRIDSGSGTRICLGLDRSGTFCLVDSGGAFPCRGLFKHVRRCNDVYHRPALNAFICGERCGADETARGNGCE